MGRPDHYSKGFCSVTEVIGVLNKPYLVPWAAKVTADYFKEHLGDEIDFEEIYSNAKKAPIAIRDGAGSIGTSVHKRIEDWLTNRPDYVVLDEQQTLIFNAFLPYLQEQKFKVVLIEEPLYHLKKKFAGTPDLICKVGDNYELRDWKVKTKIDRHELGLQMGGYSLLCKEKFGKLCERAEGICVTREARALKPFVFEREELKKYEKKFLNLLRVYKDKN